MPDLNDPGLEHGYVIEDRGSHGTVGDLSIPPAPEHLVVWHFSDLEFPPGGARAEGVGIQGAYVQDYPINQHLFDYVGQQRRWEGGILVVSGDFISGVDVERNVRPRSPTAAQDREMYREAAFHHAKEFIEALATRIRRADEEGIVIVICPGNQDVDLAAAASNSATTAVSHNAYLNAFQDYVRPGKRPFIIDRGVCLLALDTTRLIGRKLKLPKFLGRRGPNVELQLDVPIYDPAEIEAGLSSLPPENAASLVEGGLLGIVIAHHPPSSLPSAWFEVKTFDHAIGGAFAKQRLAALGFHVFLHGHKHTAVAQEETVFPDYLLSNDHVLVLGAPAFLANGVGQERGFNVIEILSSKVSGEARILVHPHEMRGRRPHRRPKRLFVLPAKRLAPASVIRVRAHIDPSGDCRLETEYNRIPVPPPDTSSSAVGGWKRNGNQWRREFERVLLSDLVALPFADEYALSDYTKVVRCTPTDDRRTGNGISVLTSNSHVSFVERVCFPCSHAVSRAHQHRVTGTQSIIPGVGEGYEGLMHVVRDPTRRLEITVELPFSLPKDPKVDVRAYTGTEDGLRENPFMEEFTPIYCAYYGPAGRIMVSVENPIVGVSYVIRWSLPETDPLNPPPTHAHRGAANRCWNELHGNGRREAADIRAWLLDEFSKVLPNNSISWSLYVPDRSVDQLTTTGSRTKLVRRFRSNSLDADGSEWVAGRGVAGRCFATKKVIEAIRPTSGWNAAYQPSVQWTNTSLEAYELTPKDREGHATLYALPFFGPNSAYWVCGVFCIASHEQEHALVLNAGSDELNKLQRLLKNFALWLTDEADLQ